jgi:hypothetical protein
MPTTKALCWVETETERRKLGEQNGISDPTSPSHKRWILGIVRIDPYNAVANTLSIPPKEYVHKNETQRNLWGSAQAVKHVA